MSTVSREVNRNGGRCGYRPVAAHRDAEAAARRPKPTKLAENPELRARVVADLERLWSPQQIARRLRDEHPDAPEQWVSHETIYKSLYVQGRGELRRELARCLRSGRAQRRRPGRSDTRGRIPDMVMISERPAEVEDRAVPGHWEGDLIIGKDGKSAIATLVERSTRYVMLAKVSRPTRRDGPRGAHPTDPAPARTPAPHPDLGPRQRDGPTRPVQHRHRCRGLLLRPPQPLAARQQREHQRPAPPVLPQRHQPLPPHPRRPRRRRRLAQRPPTRDTRTGRSQPRNSTNSLR